MVTGESRTRIPVLIRTLISASKSTILVCLLHGLSCADPFCWPDFQGDLVVGHVRTVLEDSLDIGLGGHERTMSSTAEFQDALKSWPDPRGLLVLLSRPCIQ